MSRESPVGVWSSLSLDSMHMSQLQARTQALHGVTWQSCAQRTDVPLACFKVSELSCTVATYSALYAGMLFPLTCNGMEVFLLYSGADKA